MCHWIINYWTLHKLYTGKVFKNLKSVHFCNSYHFLVNLNFLKSFVIIQSIFMVSPMFHFQSWGYSKLHSFVNETWKIYSRIWSHMWSTSWWQILDRKNVIPSTQRNLSGETTYVWWQNFVHALQTSSRGTVIDVCITLQLP